MSVLESLKKAIRSAAAHNPDVQLAPSCILWPDGDKQWENVVPRLQSDVPELFQLGTFAPDKRIGPAIWLRCVIARKLKDFSLPDGIIPILYASIKNLKCWFEIGPKTPHWMRPMPTP